MSTPTRAQTIAQLDEVVLPIDGDASYLPISSDGDTFRITPNQLLSGVVDTGITQLTGDVTAGPGSGSQAATLSTVNANVGAFGSSTAIPSFTVNGKGLITAASSSAVIAPAGTLTGNTLASGVTASSLTSVGTLTGGATGAGFTVALGTSTVTGILGAANGGTANGFTAFTGPTTSTKTFTLPDATATILTSNAAVTVAQGGTGRATGTTAYALIATGTTATGAQQTLANGATTEILVGGGASALPVWTTATGSGAPVRATSPTLSTPILGVASATSINFGQDPLSNYTKWTDFTPSLTLGGGSATGTYTGSWMRVGDGIFVVINLSITTVSTPSGGVIIGNLPVAANGSFTFPFNLYVNGASGSWTGPAIAIVNAGATTISVFEFSAGSLSSPGSKLANGMSIRAEGFYRP